MRSGAKQMSNFGSSKAMSSSFPNLSTPLDDKYSRLPDSFQVSSQREKTRYSKLPPASPPGHLFSSSSRPNDVHFSSVSPCERRSQNSPFIFKLPVDEKSLSLTHSSHSEVQPTALINYSEENKDISWYPDSLQEFLHFPENVPDQNGLVDSSTGVITSEDHAEKTDWSDWDPLISFDDALDPNWELPLMLMQWIPNQSNVVLNPYSDILVQPPQIQQHQPVQSEEFRPSPEPLSTAPPTKPRMRWTQELHEAFVEAVNQLDGSERGNIEQPDTNRSHQKVISLISPPGSYEQPFVLLDGACEKVSTPVEETNSLDLKASMGITEALRLQVELQKRLHEQLENQRKLQLQIEEQGKYLEKMFEQQRKMEDSRVKAASSTVDDHATPPSNLVCPSPGEDKPETSKHDHEKTPISASSMSTPLEEGSQDANRKKQKAQETESQEEPDHPGDVESGTQPTKRARNG
ncbi:Homeodomain-like superfamily protein [Prunus dulcis]|uniref:Homeodomain-like superfamily protein n=1 Tax=Prunus dulcis TaxID=3755 RepID=A0A4Y1RQV7_PRUDU|nr:Homeodomain-like superfamily protein [Prunus dulcis]